MSNETASATPTAATGLVDHFFRREAGRLIATLVRRFGPNRLQVVEDAVQSALASALSTWTRSGIPDNPAAWLSRVAHNKVIDELRRGATSSASDVSELIPDETVDDGEPGFAQEIPDDELRMLFVCCDEELSQQMQLVLALKLLCGFSTKEIAARLFMTDANVQKLLTRGKARLKDTWASAEREWDASENPGLASRTDAVIKVIYLLFNEGYSSQREDEVIRRDLCEEALRLCQMLAVHPVGNTPECHALLALLHMHYARLGARTDSSGTILLLEEQDRSKWDREHIQAGIQWLWRSGQGPRFSRYHAEAAVLAEHCIAPTFEQTRWEEIVDLYAMLEAIEPSPLHTLNRAIALAEWKGPAVGLRLLMEQKPPAWLGGYYLWDATIGELKRRCGDFAEAHDHIKRARDAAPTKAEAALFAKKLARCDAGDRSR